MDAKEENTDSYASDSSSSSSSSTDSNSKSNNVNVSTKQKENYSYKRRGCIRDGFDQYWDDTIDPLSRYNNLKQMEILKQPSDIFDSTQTNLLVWGYIRFILMNVSTVINDINKLIFDFVFFGHEFKSNILNAEEKKYMLSLILSTHNIQHKHFKRILQATKDGFDENTFHTMCDNKPYLICIVLTETNYIFGGYTSKLTWNGHNQWMSDPDQQCFIFLLRTQCELYKGQLPYRWYVYRKEKALCNLEDTFIDKIPCFGFGHDWKIRFKGKMIHTDLGGSYDARYHADPDDSDDDAYETAETTHFMLCGNISFNLINKEVKDVFIRRIKRVDYSNSIYA